MTTIAENLQAVKARISAACAAAGRTPDAVTLLAVSKTWPAACVRAAVAAGQRAFGENYVQEGLAKIAELGDELDSPSLEWHFIGPLQGNKTRAVAEHFHWVHSVDRLKVAQRLAGQRPSVLRPLNVCLQVNVSGEESKSGCAPAELPALAHAVAALPRLRLRGLMAIPEPTPDESLLRRRFAEVRQLRDSLAAEGLKLDTLSMGMSQDMDIAIEEGATIVRVGTAIFGERLKA